MLRKLISATLGAATLALAGPVLAGGGFGQVNGWAYGPFDSHDGCYVAREGDDGVMVGAHWVPARKEFRIVFSSKDWDELQPLIYKDIAVDVTLATPAGNQTFSGEEGMVLQVEGDIEAVVALWYGENGAQVRRALRGARSVSLTAKGQRIGTFALDGLAEGIDALLVCGDNVGGK